MTFDDFHKNQMIEKIYIDKKINKIKIIKKYILLLKNNIISK